MRTKTDPLLQYASEMRFPARVFGMLTLWLLMVCLMTSMCFASSPKNLTSQVILSDGADLLDSREEEEIRKIGEELAKLTGWDVMIVTTDDAKGKEAIEFIEDFYMDHYKQDNGAAYLIDMDNREIRIATSGEAVLYLTDDEIDSLLDTAYECIVEGEYKITFYTMIDGTIQKYRSGIDRDQYIYDEDTGEYVYYEPPKSITPVEALIAVLAAAAAGLGFSGIVCAKYRMKTGKYKYRLKDNANVSLYDQQDHFLRQVVTQRTIPKNPPPSSGGGHSGGSRSTVHHGSGGHSFGGGGRKF